MKAPVVPNLLYLWLLCLQSNELVSGSYTPNNKKFNLEKQGGFDTKNKQKKIKKNK